jgi:ribosomal protein S6--L-glutamate ligase
MRALLLGRKATGYSARRLGEAFRERGHELVPVDPLECAAIVGEGGLEVRRGGETITGDGVLPRFGPGLTEFGLQLLRHFESLGLPSLNSSDSIDKARDKFRCLQILAAAGLPVPSTVMARSPRDLDRVLDRVGAAPVIVKVLKGSQGTGVVLLREREEARRFLDIAWSQKQNLLVQRFVGESRGRDLRVLVLGDRAVAAMERQAEEGEFRANLHRGSRGRAVEPRGEAAALAVRASRAVGLQLAGVDLLPAEGGAVVLELNPSPGLEGIEAATGQDLAGRIVDSWTDHVCARR